MNKNLTLKTSGLLLVALAFTGSLQAQSASKKGKFVMPKNIKQSEYLANTVNVKVKPEFAKVFNTPALQNAAFDKVIANLGQVSVIQKFPRSGPNKEATGLAATRQVDLTRIYAISYSANTSLENTINSLFATGLFEFAEPHYIPHISYIPNDPRAQDSTAQGMYHLYRIKAIQAWNVAKGDTNTVVGITDTGVETLHQDLKDNIKHNYADPQNGVDDDNDGYIDNHSGWDIGMNDNDPQWQGNSHGVHVSGLAAASTDNSIGVAGTGFKCRFLPIKIANAAGDLIASYEGITYAADHGCKVINCSWGGGYDGMVGQNVVDYATFNKNALVVVSAGNDGAEVISYPAAYDNVLCVASTANSDFRSSFTSYGFHVDVSAPGSAVLSTLPPQTYGQQSGTSMSSPVTAGAAALLRSHYPAYTAPQIAALLKATCDTIYHLTPNTALRGKLGTGRINLYRALTATNVRFAEMIKYDVRDGNDEAFVGGDTLKINADFYNYLSDIQNVSVLFATTSNWVTILNPNHNLGNMAGGDSAHVRKPNPLRILVKPGAPANTVVSIEVYMQDSNGKLNRQRFSIVVNVDYINYHENDITVTITSNSRIGYKSDQQKDGVGFKYKANPTMIYDGGLMVGTDATHTSDNLRSTAGNQDANFGSSVIVKQVLPSVRSNNDLESVFQDRTPANQTIPVTVRQRTWAYNTVGNTKYVIIQYCIKNRGTAKLNNLYAGICADWDIDSPTVNRINEDVIRRMGYTFSTQANGLYAGIKLLSRTAMFTHYAIDNEATGKGGINMSDGYSGAEKYQSLSTNRSQAGVDANGNDVIDVVGTGPFNNINPNDSVVVGFALIAGESLADIQASADSAQVHYEDVFTTGIDNGTQASSFGLKSVYPNPFKEQATVRFELRSAGAANLELFDVQGRKVAQIWQNSTAAQGQHAVEFQTGDLPAGMYQLRLSAGNENPSTQKVIIVK